MGATNDAVNLILRGEPFRNFCHSFYDEFVEQNVAFRHRAGVKSLIIRRNLGGCCDWCQNLAGIYVYGEEPKDVYRRHDSCRCLVTSKFEGQGYQDVWSKKEFAKQRDARIEREKTIIENLVNNDRSDIIRDEEVKHSLKLGKNAKVNIPPKDIDVSELGFDYEHITTERGRNIDEETAKEWIENAVFSVTVWDGQYERFISEAGAVYVNMETKNIRTAFSYEDYSDSLVKCLKIVNEHKLSG